MGVFGRVFDFISNHWSGDSGVLARVSEHVQMSALATALALLVALPVGLYIGHTRRFQFMAVSIANLGRAIPSFGILGIVTPFLIALPGIGFYPTLVTLILLGIPPILTNTYVGVKNVDRDTVEAGRGMGLGERQILLRIELPLAAPVIVAGVRLAAVAVIATATLAALAGWGGLGRFIIDGFAQGSTVMVISGAVLVALVAIVSEILLGGFQKLVTPKGLRRRGPEGRGVRREVAPG